MNLSLSYVFHLKLHFHSLMSNNWNHDSYYSLGDYSLEIFEDPSAMALVEVKVISSLDLIDR